MIYDAHIHMGYFTRVGYAEPFYYSPRRVVGLLDRCGVDEFVVSSTCAQVEGISIEDMIREAEEMKRLAGSRAHVFCWISGRMYDADPQLSFLDCGYYEGIKLHGGETNWSRERSEDLTRILQEAQGRNWPVQFHCGETDGCWPGELAKWVELFPTVNFDFAHCRPMSEMAQVIATHENVFTDCSYMDPALMSHIAEYDWRGRMLFGSDFPAYHACERVGFTKRYRENVVRWQTNRSAMEDALGKFLKKDKKSDPYGRRSK